MVPKAQLEHFAYIFGLQKCMQNAPIRFYFFYLMVLHFAYKMHSHNRVVFCLHFGTFCCAKMYFCITFCWQKCIFAPQNVPKCSASVKTQAELGQGPTKK